MQRFWPGWCGRWARRRPRHPTPPPDPDRAQLAALVARREDLVTTIGRENNRLGVAVDPWIAKETRSLVRVLKSHLESVEVQIATLIETRQPLATASRRLHSVTGIGPVVAAVLLARLPEMGQLDHRQLASLAGLAPHACDSGLHRGKRLMPGGRAEVRRARYIAAKSASQWDPVFKAFRKRLMEAGKPFKVAIIACARKLLTVLATMFKKGEDFRKATV